jgi:uncharacterized protein YodC (DUF2158 family)
MNDKIETGDVVQLKSGGPLMTAGEISSDDNEDCVLEPGEVTCAWFQPCGATKDATLYGQAQSGTFHVDMLRKVNVTTALEELREAAADVYQHLSDVGQLGRGSGKLTRLGRALGLEVA